MSTGPGDQVHQGEKAGPCHKFPFLPSCDYDLVTLKGTNEILCALCL